MHTILSDFLSANLLPIGEDDEKLTLLDAAANDLAKQIESTPLLAYRCAIVGLDERVPASDPVHKKVAEIIANKWQTMTNKTGTSPVQVHRAVLLRALEISATTKADFRYAMTLIARNLEPAALDGKSKDAIASMLAGWESSVAKELNESWVNTVDISLPKLAKSLQKTRVSIEDLTSGFGRAAGPHDKDSKPYPTPNPHWPNAANPWSYEFAPRAAEAVYTAIQTSTQGFADGIQEMLRETLMTWSDSLERMAMRDAKTELLWIRTSLYSPSARTGYSSLDPIDLALHVVIDISRTVNKAAPPSVEFFLRDLVKELAPTRARLAKFLSSIGPTLAAWPEGKAISEAETLPKQGRRSWLDCAVRGVESSQFEEQTGMSTKHEEQLAELAVKIYRELQVRKLLVSPL
jgi:hypothetical protein